MKWVEVEQDGDRTVEQYRTRFGPCGILIGRASVQGVSVPVWGQWTAALEMPNGCTWMVSLGTTDFEVAQRRAVRLLRHSLNEAAQLFGEICEQQQEARRGIASK